jgi:RNA polymerase sigma-70 factor, ECF subfamily
VVIGEDFASVLARAQRGDEEAFESLWRDLNPALLRYLGLNDEAAEDVASDTCDSCQRPAAVHRR